MGSGEFEGINRTPMVRLSGIRMTDAGLEENLRRAAEKMRQVRTPSYEARQAQLAWAEWYAERLFETLHDWDGK